MAGTSEGGKKAAETNKKRYGSDFYARQGAKGGTQTHLSGKLALVNFAANRTRASIAGRKGGRVSRKNKFYIGPDGEEHEVGA